MGLLNMIQSVIINAAAIAKYSFPPEDMVLKIEIQTPIRRQSKRADQLTAEYAASVHVHARMLGRIISLETPGDGES